MRSETVVLCEPFCSQAIKLICTYLIQSRVQMPHLLSSFVISDIYAALDHEAQNLRKFCIAFDILVQGQEITQVFDIFTGFQPSLSFGNLSTLRALV